MTATGKKLALGGTVILGVTAYMAYLGGSASWQYYLTADECQARRESLGQQRIRVSGSVVPGSLHVAADRREATFALRSLPDHLRVACVTTLPDNLAEGINVVVEGRLDAAGVLHADKLLTRCASKYQSASVGSQASAGGDP